MRLIPKEDWTVVQRVDEHERTAAGIFLPPPSSVQAQLAPVYCRVMSVGPGKITTNGTRVPLEWKEGDIVAVMPKNNGFIVEMDKILSAVPKPDDIKMFAVQSMYVIGVVEVEAHDELRLAK